MASTNEALIARAQAAGAEDARRDRDCSFWLDGATKTIQETITRPMTPTEWGALVGFCRGCVCCRKNTQWLVPDHIVPKSKGGVDGLINRQPLCVPCNSTKRDRDWPDMRPDGWWGIVTLLYGTCPPSEVARSRQDSAMIARGNEP